MSPDSAIDAEERRSLLSSQDEVEASLDAHDGVANGHQGVNKSSQPQTISYIRGVLIVLSLWGLIFCAAINMSIMTTLQSSIAEELDAFENANWFTAVYLITLSSFAPFAAKLAAVFSPRLCISAASVFFAIGAVVTSQARSLTVLLLGRGLTGLGGAGCIMTVFTFVVEMTSEKRRGLFIGLVNTGFTSGVALGAVFAGALLPRVGWRPILALQAPFSLVAGAGIFLSVPKSKIGQRASGSPKSPWSKIAGLDFAGAICLIIGLVLLLTGLATTTIQWIPIIISPFAFAIFVYIELEFATDPVIPISILISRGVLLSSFAQLGMMIARWVVLFYVPIYAIAVRGLSPASAGSLLVPTNFGMAIGSLLTGWLHIKRPGSFYGPTVVSYVIFASTLLFLSQISRQTTSVAIYSISVLASGLASGAILTYVPAQVLHLTNPDDHAISLALLTTARGFAGSFASAIGGGLFLRTLQNRLQTDFDRAGIEEKQQLIRRLLGSPAAVERLRGQERSIAIAGYSQSLEMIFLVAAALAFIMALVQAAAGRTGFKERHAKSDTSYQAANDVHEDTL